MKVTHLLALGAVALGFSSCNLIGNAVNGGPAFSGTVEGTPPAAASYSLAAVQFTTFGGTAPEQSETAAFASAVQIGGGTGGYSGFLVPSIELGGDTQRFYKFIIYEDKTGNGRYDLDATNDKGQKDAVLADSANGKTASGNRFLVTDVKKDTTTNLTVGRSDDLVTQGLAGITITY
jgi:hypothetical protein